MAGLTAQQRKFADLVLSGETQISAHRLAGYTGKNDNARAASASVILRNANVAAYMAEQAKAASEMAQIDLKWLIKEAVEVYEAAKQDAAYGPAFVGIKEISILTGNRVEKTEQTVIQHEDRLAQAREKLNERRPTTH
jgi:phage terminase small subunit